MNKIIINKKIFISRPMNGVTRDEDNKLLKDIREALIKEYVLGNFVNAEVVNTWLGPVVPDDISDEQARVWRLGRAISDMAAADVLIFVGCPWINKGCAVEFEVYNRYKDIMQKQWANVLFYSPYKKALTAAPGLSKCTYDASNLIIDLIYGGYSIELIQDAVSISKKIIDTRRTNNEA